MFGIEVEEIELWLLGGVSKLRGEAHAPGDELRYALAGPAVSALITACFGALAFALPASVPAWLSALVGYELIINALILGFNLVPAFPLDGAACSAPCSGDAAERCSRPPRSRRVWGGFSATSSSAWECCCSSAPLPMTASGSRSSASSS